jgi:thiamine pyrophosphokinase
MRGKQAVIVGAAPCDGLEYLRPYLTGEDFILCADGGESTARRAGLVPDAYVGDNDSGGTGKAPSALLLPREKDFTDSEAALYRSAELGFRRVLLCACTGGRMDHHLANLCLLERARELGVEALLLDEDNEVRFVGPGSYEVENEPPYRYLSLLPLDERLTGVSMEGLRYCVQERTFLRTRTLGVSNEIPEGCTARITIGTGRGLLIRSDRLPSQTQTK